MSSSLILGQIIFAIIAAIAVTVYMDKSYDRKHPQKKEKFPESH